MFEVGKRYRSNQSYEELIKGEIYTLTTLRQKDIAEWKNENDEYIGPFCLFRFDPTPIDDTPAPRMVTTCDIGARVVRGRDWTWRDQDGGAGGKGAIVEDGDYVGGGGWCSVKWDDEPFTCRYRIGFEGKYDLYYADEQPTKEEAKTPAQYEKDVRESLKKDFDLPIEEATARLSKLAELSHDIPDTAPGIASIMIGSKPHLMYGSLMQIQGPTKDEEARNARTEEERKRYGNISL